MTWLLQRYPNMQLNNKLRDISNTLVLRGYKLFYFAIYIAKTLVPTPLVIHHCSQIYGLFSLERHFRCKSKHEINKPKKCVY